MDNTLSLFFSVFALILSSMSIFIIFLERQRKKKYKHKKLRPHLVFHHFHHHKNYNYMAIVTSLNLTSLAPVELTVSVADANNGNAPIAGILSGLTYTPADPAQDIAVVDESDPLGVDIHAVSLQGGTSVTGSGTFVSTALNPDGTPVLSGTMTGTLVITNNVVVAVLNPVLVFNQ